MASSHVSGSGGSGIVHLLSLSGSDGGSSGGSSGGGSSALSSTTGGAGVVSSSMSSSSTKKNDANLALWSALGPEGQMRELQTMVRNF